MAALPGRPVGARPRARSTRAARRTLPGSSAAAAAAAAALAALAALLLARAASALPAGVGRDCGQSVCFSGNFAHNAVLQRAPQRAALYGASGANFSAGTAMTLTLAGVGPDGAAYNKTWPTASGADGTWKVLLDPLPAWGNYSATISCPLCSGGQTSATIHSLTFGDVLVCGGQSNMWIPMVSAFTRNGTYEKLKSGKYNNLFTFVQGDYNNGADARDAWIVPGAAGDDCRVSPNPTPGGSITWCPILPIVLAPSPNTNQKGSFSAADFVPAACLFTGIGLTDLLLAAGEAPPPIGLYANPQGGTTIEAWLPLEVASACVNATCLCDWPVPGWQNCPIYQPLNASCYNGGSYHAKSQSLFNMTVAAMLWYQGEFDHKTSITCAQADLQRSACLPLNRAPSRPLPVGENNMMFDA